MFALGGFVCYKLLKFASRQVKRMKVVQMGKDALNRRNAKQVKFAKPDLDEDKVLNMGILELRAELIKGSFTSVDLVNLFGQRCLSIGRQLCLTTEECFEQALELAKQRDQERQQAIALGKADELPLMHGVPMSVKDNIALKGYTASVGTCYLLDQICEDDAVVVKLFLKAGAIPIVKGNLPQSALSIHSMNYVWGEAKNPRDHSRSCGGSSGGDAGLVAARCVPFGIGTDIGGSLRFPAAFCGIYGFKPTQNRLSKKGALPSLRKRTSVHQHILGTIGPMGWTCSDLTACMKVSLDKNIHLLDPAIPPTPWNQAAFDDVSTNRSQHRIGILAENENLPISNGIKRALKITEQALRDLGYEVVEVKLDRSVWKAYMDVYAQIIGNGAAKVLKAEFEANEEPLVPSMKGAFFYNSLSSLMKLVVRRILVAQGW